MKLTKTQIALLQEAARNSEGIAGFQHGFYAGRKGTPTFGDRNFRAYKGLIKLGLATHRNHLSSSHPLVGNTTTCHSTDTSFYITDAGRAAIANV
jgi:hypothetical protein